MLKMCDEVPITKSQRDDSLIFKWSRNLKPVP